MMNFELDRYFWTAVVGLPLLMLLVTGPGMWSEHWGWKFMERLDRRWKRLFGKTERTK